MIDDNRLIFVGNKYNEKTTLEKSSFLYCKVVFEIIF